MMPPWPPRLTGAGSAWEYFYEPDQTRIRLRNVRLHRDGELTAVLWFFTPDGRFIPYSGVVNIAAPQTREKIARFLESRWPTGNWVRHLDALYTELYARLTEGDPAVELSGAAPAEETPYVIYPLIPEGEISIVYGYGGVGKGWLALLLARAVISGNVPAGLPFAVHKTGPVIYLDYETTEGELRRRWRRVCGGADYRLVYRRCIRPLADDLDYLAGLIQDTSPALVIVDSAGLAAGGDLNSPTAPITLFHALRTLNCTALVIAHAPKNTTEPSVYGSVYFTNLARNVWEVRAEVDPGTPELVLALLHRKTNVGVKHAPIALRIVINHAVEVYPADPSAVEGATTTRDVVLDALRSGPQSLSALVEMTGLSADALRAALRRLEAAGLVERTGRGLWAVRQSQQTAAGDDVPF